MASQRDIKRRIKSIKSTAQITKAMQMVAAARMRRAQERVAASRPYAGNIREIVADISGRSGADSHPLLQQREVRNVGLVMVTPDRGLAGPLVTNINREALRLVRSLEHPLRVVTVGRKARTFSTRLGWDRVAEFTEIGDQLGISDASPVARQVLDMYEARDVDVVYLVYSEFVSTLRQNPKRVQLLPVVPPETTDKSHDDGPDSPWEYEPDDPEKVLSSLLPRYIEFSLYQALLENSASEQSARMVAMSAATDAANDLVKDLSLLANKARQAEITKEISEISGAAEALRLG